MTGLVNIDVIIAPTQHPGSGARAPAPSSRLACHDGTARRAKPCRGRCNFTRTRSHMTAATATRAAVAWSWRHLESTKTASRVGRAGERKARKGRRFRADCASLRMPPFLVAPSWRCVPPEHSHEISRASRSLRFICNYLAKPASKSAPPCTMPSLNRYNLLDGPGRPGSTPVAIPLNRDSAPGSTSSP